MSMALSIDMNFEESDRSNIEIRSVFPLPCEDRFSEQKKVGVYSFCPYLLHMQGLTGCIDFS